MRYYDTNFFLIHWLMSLPYWSVWGWYHDPETVQTASTSMCTFHANMTHRRERQWIPVAGLEVLVHSTIEILVGRLLWELRIIITTNQIDEKMALLLETKISNNWSFAILTIIIFRRKKPNLWNSTFSILWVIQIITPAIISTIFWGMITRKSICISILTLRDGICTSKIGLNHRRHNPGYIYVS